MTQRWRALAVLATIARAAAPVEAQDSPRDVAAAFFQAVAEERWRDAAGVLDLRAFERYRRQQVQWMRVPAPEPTITVEELMRHDPEMPREVAEYRLKEMRRIQRDHGDLLEHLYAGVRSVDTLAALSVQDAAARWLQAKDHRWIWRRSALSAARRGCPVPPESPEPAVAQAHEITGIVAVGDTIAYVLHEDPVFRMKSGDIDLHGPAPSVLQLRRRRGRWEILPREDVFGVVGGVVAFHCEPTDPPPRKPPGTR
jgi:hypothetical protein